MMLHVDLKNDGQHLNGKTHIHKYEIEENANANANEKLNNDQIV